MGNKIINITFHLLIIVILVVSIFLNKQYKEIINRRIIDDKNSYNKYIDYKFVMFDINNAKKTRFSISSKEKENLDVYIISFDDKNILLELSSSTVLTSNINLMKMEDDDISNELKDTYKRENDIKKIEKGYYTNKNIKQNENIVLLKILITLVIIALAILFIIINLLQIILLKLKRNA